MGTSRLRWVLALTSLAYFIVVLDSTVVITALPRMQQDLHVGLDTLQWTVNAYGIAFAAGIITAAALGDRCGRRRVFIAGLALFTLASAACAVAPGATALIVARAVQGVGRRGRAAAQPDDPDHRVPGAAPRRHRRHLRRAGRAGRRGRAAGRRRGHRRAGLALDLLDQRPARRGREPAVAAAAAGELRLRRPGSTCRASRWSRPAWSGWSGGWPGPGRPLGQRRGDRRTGRGRGAAGRVLRVGGPGGRADAAAPAAPHPGVRGRERDRVPDDRLDVFRRVPDHAVLPVRAGLLAAGHRAAAAALARSPRC